MPNKNYRAGRRAEWRAREMLHNAGYHTVIRSAGSKGPFDLIGLGRSRVILVQVKNGRPIARSERDHLVTLKSMIPLFCGVEIWRYDRGQSLPDVEVI